SCAVARYYLRSDGWDEGACSAWGWTCISASFFFQAEDGIRDDLVTGVQTCALPISSLRTASSAAIAMLSNRQKPIARSGSAWWRSEERRVGKECRARRSPDH